MMTKIGLTLLLVAGFGWAVTIKANRLGNSWGWRNSDYAEQDSRIRTWNRHYYRLLLATVALTVAGSAVLLLGPAWG